MKSLKKVLKIPSTFRSKSEMDDLMGSRSVEELARHLEKGEKVLRIVRGSHNGQIGVMAATSKRVIFMSRGILDMKSYEFDYDDILAAAVSSRLFTSTIMIRHNSDTFIVNKVARNHAVRFADFVDATAKQELEDQGL